MGHFRCPLLAITVALAVAGCHNPESDFVGTWANAGQTLQVRADHTFRWSVGYHKIADPSQTSTTNRDETWKYENEDLVLTPVSVDGVPVAESKKILASTSDKVTPAMRRWYDYYDKQHYYRLDNAKIALHPNRDRYPDGQEPPELRNAAYKP